MTRKRRTFTDEFKQEAVRLTGLSVHPRRPIPPTPRATRGEKNFLFFVLFHVKHSGVRRAQPAATTGCSNSATPPRGSTAQLTRFACDLGFDLLDLYRLTLLRIRVRQQPPVFSESRGLAGGKSLAWTDGFQFAHRTVGIPNGHGQAGHFVVNTIRVRRKAFDKHEVVFH